ncbi:MAG: DoxX family protein [Saprospiraceae bacterium]|jgi:putative oxidoreductase|nr:DoxX family protein [Saprospiraceae bacterium]
MNTSRSTDVVLLLLRLTFGGIMIINHGWGKMTKLFGDAPIKFGDPIGIGAEASLSLAVFAEVFCAFFLVIGLFTKQVAVPLIITMMVAVFIVHGDDPFKKMEMGILYLVPYISLFLMGAGWYSIDAQVRKV